MPAGRKTKFDTDSLCKILEEERLSILNEEGKLQNPSHHCWLNIAEKYGQGISPKYLYTIVLSNRFKVREKLNLTFASHGTDASAEQEPSPDDPDKINSDDESIAEEENRLAFQITLSSQEWEQVYSSTDYFRGDRCTKRSYEVLKPFSWSTIINEHFFELTKRRCCLIYKRCKVTPNGTKFIRLTGQCKSCQSTLRGVVENPPKPNSRVVIDCTYDGNHRNCITQRKRRILGENRDHYQIKLLKENKTASFIQKEDAARIMDFGDAEPSHLPTLNALRIMKCKAKMDSRLDDDPVLAIIRLKSSLPYNDMIRDVGYDHFYVHYWSTNQLNTYRIYSRQNRIPCISIDATGSVVTPINLFSGRKTKPIFLYEIAVLDKCNKLQFSAAEMLSEAHDNNAISYWISRWLINSIPPPKIVVTDMSRALMMGCVKALTQYSTLKKYLEVCWSLLQDKNAAEKPCCMLRNDFAHTIHLMSGWPEIKNADSPRLKKFYLRCFALVIGCNEWDEAKRLLRYIFTISLSESEGSDNDGLATACELSISYLKDRISGIPSEIEEKIDADEMVDEPEEIRDETYDETEIPGTEIQSIYDRCVLTAKEEEGDRINPFYKPKIAENLLKICDLLPCWSAIMLPVFEYGQITHTTAASESLFKEVKVDGFQHEKLPMRADAFVEKHLNFLMGATTLAGANYRRKDMEDEPAQHIEYAEEDWRGLICQKKVEPKQKIQMYSKPKERSPEITNLQENNQEVAPPKKVNFKINKKENPETKKNYLIPDPSIAFQQITKTKSPVMGLIKNGNLAQIKSIKLDGQHYTFTNTCTFDALVQILFVAYIDSRHYCDFINTHAPQLTLFDLVRNGVRNGVTAQLYRKRAQILKTLFSDVVDEQLKKNNLSINVSANTTINFLMDETLKSSPTIIEKRHCPACNNVRERRDIRLIINLVTDDLTFLVDAIQSRVYDQPNCAFCGQKIPFEHRHIELASHLFVEPAPSIEYSKATNESDLKTTLRGIPSQFQLLEKNYFLRGVIHFESPKFRGVRSIGHYIAYCFRQENNSWEKYDDLAAQPRLNLRPSTVVSAQCLIYTQ